MPSFKKDKDSVQEKEYFEAVKKQKELQKKEEKAAKEKELQAHRARKQSQALDEHHLNSEFGSRSTSRFGNILVLQLFQFLAEATVVLFTELGSKVLKQEKQDGEAESPQKGKESKRPGPPSGSERKAGGIPVHDKEELKKWAGREGFIPIVIVSAAVIVIGMTLGQEGYTAGLREDYNKISPKEVNASYYDDLGVPRDAPTTEIRRAYKTLAKKWHPDKNPNCGECKETFSKIAKAYETLNDEKARREYDETGGVADAELVSPRSVPITPEEFESVVVRSNDYWAIQLYEPKSGQSSTFHPFWEHQVQKHGHLMRFGRVDMTDIKDYSWLPFKPVLFPTVFKISKRFGLEILPVTATHETHTILTKFVLSSFPLIGLPLTEQPGSLNRWLESRTSLPKVLLALPIGDKAGTGSKSLYGPRKVASSWDELFEFRHATPEDIRKLSLKDKHKPPPELMEKLPTNESTLNAAVYLFGTEAGKSHIPRDIAQIKWPDENEALEGTLRNHFADVYIENAAVLHQSNLDLLCSGVADQLRVFCLVLIDPPEGAVQKAREELRASKAAHDKEQEEFKASGGELSEGEDPFHVNVVKILTKGNSVLTKSTSNCRAEGFPRLVESLKGQQSFLVEADTLRVAVPKQTSSYQNLYQSLGLNENLEWLQKPDEDDLKFEDLVFNRRNTLPDCDEGFTPYLRRKIRENPLVNGGCCLIFVLVVLECVCQALVLMSWKWCLASASVLGIGLLQMPPFFRALVASSPF